MSEEGKNIEIVVANNEEEEERAVLDAEEPIYSGVEELFKRINEIDVDGIITKFSTQYGIPSDTLPQETSPIHCDFAVKLLKVLDSIWKKIPASNSANSDESFFEHFGRFVVGEPLPIELFTSDPKGAFRLVLYIEKRGVIPPPAFLFLLITRDEKFMEEFMMDEGKIRPYLLIRKGFMNDRMEARISENATNENIAAIELRRQWILLLYKRTRNLIPLMFPTSIRSLEQSLKGGMNCNEKMDDIFWQKWCNTYKCQSLMSSADVAMCSVYILSHINQHLFNSSLFELLRSSIPAKLGSLEKKYLTDPNTFGAYEVLLKLDEYGFFPHGYVFPLINCCMRDPFRVNKLTEPLKELVTPFLRLLDYVSSLPSDQRVSTPKSELATKIRTCYEGGKKALYHLFPKLFGDSITSWPFFIIGALKGEKQSEKRMKIVLPSTIGEMDKFQYTGLTNGCTWNKFCDDYDIFNQTSGNCIPTEQITRAAVSVLFAIDQLYKGQFIRISKLAFSDFSKYTDEMLRDESHLHAFIFLYELAHCNIIPFSFHYLAIRTVVDNPSQLDYVNILEPLIPASIEMLEYCMFFNHNPLNTFSTTIPICCLRNFSLIRRIGSETSSTSRFKCAECKCSLRTLRRELNPRLQELRRMTLSAGRKVVWKYAEVFPQYIKTWPTILLDAMFKRYEDDDSSQHFFNHNPHLLPEKLFADSPYWIGNKQHFKIQILPSYEEVLIRCKEVFKSINTLLFGGNLINLLQQHVKYGKELFASENFDNPSSNTCYRALFCLKKRLFPGPFLFLAVFAFDPARIPSYVQCLSYCAIKFQKRIRLVSNMTFVMSQRKSTPENGWPIDERKERINLVTSMKMLFGPAFPAFFHIKIKYLYGGNPIEYQSDDMRVELDGDEGILLTEEGKLWSVRTYDYWTKWSRVYGMNVCSVTTSLALTRTARIVTQLDSQLFNGILSEHLKAPFGSDQTFNTRYINDQRERFSFVALVSLEHWHLFPPGFVFLLIRSMAVDDSLLGKRLDNIKDIVIVFLNMIQPELNLGLVPENDISATRPRMSAEMEKLIELGNGVRARYDEIFTDLSIKWDEINDDAEYIDVGCKTQSTSMVQPANNSSYILPAVLKQDKKQRSGKRERVKNEQERLMKEKEQKKLLKKMKKDRKRAMKEQKAKREQETQMAPTLNVQHKEQMVCGPIGIGPPHPQNPQMMIPHPSTYPPPSSFPPPIDFSQPPPGYPQPVFIPQGPPTVIQWQQPIPSFYPSIETVPVDPIPSTSNYDPQKVMEEEEEKRRREMRMRTTCTYDTDKLLEEEKEKKRKEKKDKREKEGNEEKTRSGTEKWLEHKRREAEREEERRRRDEKEERKDKDRKRHRSRSEERKKKSDRRDEERKKHKADSGHTNAYEEERRLMEEIKKLEKETKARELIRRVKEWKIEDWTWRDDHEWKVRMTWNVPREGRIWEEEERESINRLHHIIDEYFAQNVQRIADHDRKMRVFHAIQNYTKDLLTRLQTSLSMIGSSNTDLASRSSNLDLALISLNPLTSPSTISISVFPHIRFFIQHYNGYVLSEDAIKLSAVLDMGEGAVKVTVRVDKASVYFSRVLTLYDKADSRLGSLMLYIKGWISRRLPLEGESISYLLTSLLIHFLQCGVSPPVLPCLHSLFPQRLIPNEAAVMDVFTPLHPPLPPSMNRDSLGSLLLHFFQYYSIFEFDRFVISIRDGALVPRALIRTALPEIAIEHPFDRSCAIAVGPYLTSSSFNTLMNEAVESIIINFSLF